MMNIIQDHMKGISLENSLGAIAKLERIDPAEDLNKVCCSMTAVLCEPCMVFTNMRF